MSRLAERNQLFSVCKYGVSFLSIAVFGHKLLLLLPIPTFWVTTLFFLKVCFTECDGLLIYRAEAWQARLCSVLESSSMHAKYLV